MRGDGAPKRQPRGRSCGTKGALLPTLPWPGQSFGISASSGQQALPDLLPGEESRVTEEVQPPPGSQDWDVLLTHRAGLRGPLREGSRQPPSCRSGSRLQWLTLATRRHCSPNYLPRGQKRGPRAPARRPKPPPWEGWPNKWRCSPTTCLPIPQPSKGRSGG